MQNDNIRNNLENISFKIINPFWQHKHTHTLTHTYIQFTYFNSYRISLESIKYFFEYIRVSNVYMYLRNKCTHTYTYIHAYILLNIYTNCMHTYIPTYQTKVHIYTPMQLYIFWYYFKLNATQTRYEKIHIKKGIMQI